MLWVLALTGDVIFNGGDASSLVPFLANYSTRTYVSIVDPDQPFRAFGFPISGTKPTFAELFEKSGLPLKFDRNEPKDSLIRATGVRLNRWPHQVLAANYFTSKPIPKSFSVPISGADIHTPIGMQTSFASIAKLFPRELSVHWLYNSLPICVASPRRDAEELSRSLALATAGKFRKEKGKLSVSFDPVGFRSLLRPMKQAFDQDRTLSPLGLSSLQLAYVLLMRLSDAELQKLYEKRGNEILYRIGDNRQLSILARARIEAHVGPNAPAPLLAMIDTIDWDHGSWVYFKNDSMATVKVYTKPDANGVRTALFL